MEMYIEVLLVGMLWWSIPAAMTSSTDNNNNNNNNSLSTLLGDCWKTIDNCIVENEKSSNSNPRLNVNSTSFNTTEYLCCSLIQETKLNDKECFCTIGPFLHQDPAGPNVTFLLTACNVAYSMASVDYFCSSVSPTSDSTPVVLSPNQAPPTSGKKKVIIIGISSSAALVLVLMAIGIGIYCTKTRNKLHSQIENVVPNPRPADMIAPELLQYEFKALKTATNNFSKDNTIGRGGFGIVYKGMLENGQVMAVKRLSKNADQGDKEFKNEVGLLAKLQHRNLVRLTGFCLAKDERLLVYEFAHNKSLDYFLFDPEKQKELNWSTRYDIIKGIARGMLYLHEDSHVLIVHRDLKAANILLDEEMNAKISDFGMARIFRIEQSHVFASRIVGTCGYMAPEYLIHGQVSTKSDVYSFGVLILEIVSGKRISSLINLGEGGENLLSYVNTKKVILLHFYPANYPELNSKSELLPFKDEAWKCLQEEKVMEFMDPTLQESCSKNEIRRCINLGLLCVQEDQKKRPSMEKIMVMFNSEFSATSLSMPPHPSFLFGGHTDQSTSSNNNASLRWSSSEPTSSKL